MKVPIAFAFDSNLVFPASVCLSSLLKNANAETFYDIYILHSRDEDFERSELNRLPLFYANCRIQYRTVDGFFDSAYEIRGITTPAYYRLLIPELIPEYDKVIYSDVDVIFRMDLSELYSMDLSDNYLAATRDVGLNLSKDGVDYIDSMTELEVGNYLQSGFIMLNSKKIREDGLVAKFKEQAKRKLKFQDQDILNIVCKGKVKFLSLEYNMTDYSFYYAMKERELLYKWFDDMTISNAVANGNLHFNGHKPWKKYCVNFDIWWEYYRKSPFYDEKFYFDFYYNKLDELDQLTLWKRIKILVRYFIYGRKK
ncbi:MAG: glycosyltransferase family 8 protein [Bacteroidales bacterium]|nr:glycosyltransferase family 8 protein [Bacteroidales bacterium]